MPVRNNPALAGLKHLWRRAAAFALLAGLASPFAAGEALRLAIGVTAAGSPIQAVIPAAALDPEDPTPRALVVAGLDGKAASVDVAASLARAPGNSRFALAVVLNAFPDREPMERFPPPGPAYGGTYVESQYLWRFLGMLAPDLVVDLRTDAGPSSLQRALEEGGKPADTGRIPAAAIRLDPQVSDLETLRRQALAALGALMRSRPASAARRELTARLRRTPLEAARQLEQAYGHRLDRAVYIPALALLGRLRLGDLEGASRLPAVERIAKPFLDGQPPFAPRATGSHVAGHLIFAELHERTGNPAYLQLARAAAELGFEPDGELKASMPFHNEMSDSVFMGCAILARVGRLTGERRYFGMALRHLRFMRQLDLRSDGLYRHSPRAAAAWGRGNGFPALGLALALSDWPPAEAGYAEVLDAYRQHLQVLARHQDPTGTWHQVVDRPESYREFSSTAMIGFAITRGLRKGWLPRADFESAADSAWRAVQTRLKSDATLVDVCQSTGKQGSLRAYYDREAILGRDDRGGAMALLLATERASWVRER